MATLRTRNRLVLVAPTGSGKTTQVPQMLLDGITEISPSLADKKIIVLQPRRVAARTVSARVAWERKGQLGQEVGYQIRFEDHTSLGTRICFVTEGILLRWLQDDRSLRDVGMILFDEFHERNLLSDVSLALVKELQRTTRPDLKIVVMSATLDAEPVAKYLDNASILVSEGQSYPVEVNFLSQRDERSLSDQAADAVEQIVNSGAEGDILIFMPGMGEINATINAIQSARVREKLALVPLHGELPPDDQDRAFTPNPLRKVVVSTNVAETSVTIDGIRHVVDGGVARVARYDAERGIGTLFIEEISRASSDQRKGRAGRTAPGTCYRLWTESNHLNRPERNTPEIQRSDLAEIVLLLHSLGIKKASQFDWLDKPDSQAVERAENLLHTLGAIDAATEQITAVGRQMLRLPMHPRYSRMLVEAAKHNCVRAAALCASLVSGRDILVRLGRDEKHITEARELFEANQESDFYTLMRAFEFAKKNNFSVEACRSYGVHAQIARQVNQTYEQLLDVAAKQRLLKADDTSAGTDASSAVASALPQCLMAGFIDQLCKRRDAGTLDCDLTEGRQGTLVRESVVQNSPLFVAASIREVPTRGSENLVLLGLATAVKREWIEQTFPEQLFITVEHLFDRTHKRVAAVKMVRFHNLVLQFEHQREVDPTESGRSLAEACRKGYFELPNLNHEIKQFMSRVNLLCAVSPELDFPKFDEAAIIDCLARSFKGLTLVKEAQAAPLRNAFFTRLAPEQLQWLDELVPLSIPWHDGKKLKLLYSEQAVDEDGEPNSPELQVKLHECFAVKEHPHICEGKLPVKLWLCSPDGKRIEPTFNWPSFKSLTYPKLKSSLQKKFPGTLWV
ncbi:MAG: hrpB [Verrucomicrobiales bacterium]|nr:hrpB [Verrucomicrobiales bacterium]